MHPIHAIKPVAVTKLYPPLQYVLFRYTDSRYGVLTWRREHNLQSDVQPRLNI